MKPLVDDGWFMLTEGPLAITYVHDQIGPESFARHLRALARDIDEWRGDKRAIMYDTPAPLTMSAEQRREVGDLLEARKDKLRAITAGYVMVTPSAVVRGLLTAVFWIAPPPYDYHVAATPEEGFRWLATRAAWLEPEETLSRYIALKGELLVRMRTRRAG